MPRRLARARKSVSSDNCVDRRANAVLEDKGVDGAEEAEADEDQSDVGQAGPVRVRVGPQRAAGDEQHDSSEESHGEPFLRWDEQGA
jgi:hypothetical protein